MTKDYFQDILPPHSSQGAKSLRPTPPKPPHGEEIEDEERFSGEEEVSSDVPKEARSIRNITVSSRAARRPLTLEHGPSMPMQKKSGPRIWMWAIAAILIVVLGVLFLVATRPSTITVIPRSQTIVFDALTQLTAYPAESSPGTLSYTVERMDFDDSKVVKAQGTEEVREKAKGTLTIYNNYSAEPVRLIATTRFESPDGLIFRITEDVSVPGKKGAIPGELAVAVEADQPGDTYNIGPVNKFTLPGLKGNAAMYADIYARSSETMTGGFIGQRPRVSSGEIESARAEIRSRLEQKVREGVSAKTNAETIALSDLVKISYQSLPTLPEGTDSARVRERATAEIPVFPAEDFARAAAKGVSADAEQSSVFLRNPAAIRAAFVADEEPVLGSTPIVFTLSGTNQIVWNVDISALTEALAGKDQGAFEAIVASFPGIDEARARIQPFWKKSFPADPSTIHVRLEEPKALDAL